MFGNQTLLCQMVLPVRSCAAGIRPDRERAWRARSAGRFEGPCDKGLAEFRTIQADCPFLGGRLTLREIADRAGQGGGRAMPTQRSRGGHPSPQCLRRETSRRAAHRVAQSFPQASFGLGFGAVIHVTE